MELKTWIFNAKTAFGYIPKFLNLIRKTDKAYFLYLLGETLLAALQTFPNMFLLKASADALTKKIPFRSYVYIVLIWILLDLLRNLLWNYFNSSGPAHRGRLLNILKNRFSEKCLEMDYEMLSDKEILDKKELADNAIHKGFGSATWEFLIIFSNIFVLCGTLAIILSIDHITLLITIFIIAISSIPSYLFQKKQYGLSVKMTELNRKYDYLNNTFSDFTNAKEIRVYKMIGPISNRLRSLINDKQKIVCKDKNISLIKNIISIVINTLLELSVYIILGLKVLSGAITLGSFLLCADALRQLRNQLSGISNWFVEYSNASRYIKHYFDFINLKSKFKSGNQQPLSDFSDFEIKFNNVSFKYPGQDEYSLRNINISIMKGEKLSIVGENGAGKTTFIKLLMRLYDPTIGSITLNGINIKDICYDEYLSLFSTIFQDYKLFAFTIGENITSLDNVVSDDHMLYKAAYKAGIDSKISLLKYKYNTRLYRIFDNEGVELSGGEEQKLAIARALYKNSSIIILDEPTSALDPRAEYEIYKSFSTLVDGKTSIFISHRLSSTRFSDKIAVFDKGEIIEYGAHDTLIINEGLYHELFKMQAQYYDQMWEAGII